MELSIFGIVLVFWIFFGFLVNHLKFFVQFRQVNCGNVLPICVSVKVMYRNFVFNFKEGLCFWILFNFKCFCNFCGFALFLSCYLCLIFKKVGVFVIFMFCFVFMFGLFCFVVL